MQGKSKISIITASYNSEKTIGKTIESILNQSINSFEYIIVDGKSSDTTMEIIKSFEKKFSKKNICFKCISEEDSGIYEAWNKGIKMANGDWIGFLGSDDMMYKNALKGYEKVIEDNENIEYISSKVKMTKNNRLIKVIAGQWNWKTFKKYMNVAHVGSLHSRKYFQKYGLYNTKFKIAGDYEMLLRSKKNLKYYFLDEITAEMDAGGLSNNQARRAISEAKYAKINTAGTNKHEAEVYFYWALFKAKLKDIYNWNK